MEKKKPIDKKKRWSWACLGLSVFSCLCLAFGGLQNLILLLFNKANNAASIGIIGGADGPTAIFVTSKAHDAALPPEAIYVLLMVMGIIGFIALRKIKED